MQLEIEIHSSSATGKKQVTITFIQFKQENKVPKPNMLRKLSNLMLFLAFSASMYASPIDKQTALSRAQSFVQEKGINLELRESQRRTVSPGRGNEAPCYYIFNSEDEQGFVIVAGDNLLYPILGYSDKGSIDPDNMPEGLAALLNGYEEATYELRAQEQEGLITPTTDHPRRGMTLAKNPIEPFLIPYFGHYAPYYNQNPKYDGKKRSSCACSTVAVAEVMAHFKYPPIIPRAEGYTTETLGIELEDLPAYEIDWNNILPNYLDFDYTQTEEDEISRFMFHLGQYLRSDFQEDSGSPSNYIYTALKNFGYRSSQLLSLTSYLMSDFEDIFYDNLLKGKPIIVSGCNISIDGARHVFIFDGYDQDGKFHIDWGYNGNCQGYYSFSNLSPYNNTSFYTYLKNIWCIFDIEPKTNPVTEEENIPYASLDLTSLSVNNGKVVTSRRNYNGFPGTFYQGIGLVDENNKLKKVLDWSSVYLKNSSEITTKTWSIDNIGDVKDGTYYIFAVSRLENGDSIWHFDKVRNVSKNGVVKATIQNGTPKLTLLPTVEYHSFEADDNTTFYRGAAREIKLKLTNHTMDMVNRVLYFYEDSITPLQYGNINIPARCTMDYNFIYLPKEAGEHKLWISADTARTQILFKKNVTVKSAVRYSLNLDTIIIDNYNTKQGYLYGNELRVKVKITNNGSNDYNDYFRILLKKEGWYDTKKPLIHLPVGKSMWIDFDSKDMAYYHTFTLFVYYKTVSSQDPDVFNNQLFSRYIVPRPAIRMWKEDGKMYAIPATTNKLNVPEDALVLDLTAPNIDIPSNIVPNSNPNTLYYVTKPYDSLSSLNQIVNGRADTITLTDNIPCYVPMDFIANHAKYTRTFEKGFMGKVNENNWTTIMVPFNVDYVYNTVDSTYVEWYKPGEEEGDFWMREYYGEDGFYVFFTDAEEMRANVPYIITVPGMYFGEETSLVGKPLVFSGDNTHVISRKVVSDGQSFDFQGSYYKTETYGNYIYMLDEDNRGNYFAYVPGESEVNPFRGYFTSKVEPKTGSRLYMASYIKRHNTTETDHIMETLGGKVAFRPSLDGVYTITGRKMSTPSNASAMEILNTLPKGIYIINGKKYVK